jgi:hypothetical protein
MHGLLLYVLKVGICRKTCLFMLQDAAGPDHPQVWRFMVALSLCLAQIYRVTVLFVVCVQKKWTNDCFFKIVLFK